MPNIGNSNSATEHRVCLNCHGPIIGKRRQAKYCSQRCRVLAANRRHYHADIERARAANRAKYARRKAARIALANQPAPSIWGKVRAAIARLFVGNAK